MVSFAKAVVDTLAAATIRLGAPLFRAVGRWPGGYPRYLRAADKAGVHWRSTHYYHPTYTDSDLPADLGGARALPGLDLNAAGQLALLARFAVAAEVTGFPESSGAALAFHYANGAYEHGDAEALYAMLRHHKPKRVIEIGSGHSTRMAKAALDANRRDDPAYDCRHVCIEPYEMDWLEQLGVEVLRERVQDVPLSFFAQLEAGDVLFIDSSHVIRPHGDVLYEFQQLVPSLPKGVLVHVHDIFTPCDYPEKWVRNERRLWNEQYLMEAMLAHSPRYRVTLALNWLTQNHRAAMDAAFPSMAGATCAPGGFWFEVVQ